MGAFAGPLQYRKHVLCTFHDLIGNCYPPKGARDQNLGAKDAKVTPIFNQLFLLSLNALHVPDMFLNPFPEMWFSKSRGEAENTG
jgi:hypothetical protein